MKYDSLDYLEGALIRGLSRPAAGRWIRSWTSMLSYKCLIEMKSVLACKEEQLNQWKERPFSYFPAKIYDWVEHL